MADGNKETVVLLRVERWYIILNLQILLTLHKTSEFCLQALLAVKIWEMSCTSQVCDFFSFKSPYNTDFASTLKQFAH